MGIADIENDGISEVFISMEPYYFKEDNPTSIQILDETFIAIKQYNMDYGNVVPPVSTADLNDDGIKELLFWIVSYDTAFLDIRDVNGKQLAKFKAVTKDEFTDREKKVWDCRAHFLDYFDVNGDGRKDLIMDVRTYYADSPRGLFAFEYPSGKLIWKHQMGAALTYSNAADIDGDSFPEYCISTTTPENLPEPVYNTKDDISYLMIFEHTGQLVVCDTLGIAGTHAFSKTVDINNDDILDCVVVLNANQKEAKGIPSEVLVYDMKRKRLRKVGNPIRHSLCSFIVEDIDNDGKIEVLLFDDSNSVYLYEFSDQASLDLINNVHVPNVQLLENRIAMVADLDLDGHNEIVLDGKQNLYILNDRLKVKAVYPPAYWVGIAYRGKKKPVLVVNIPDAGCEALRYEANHLYLLNRNKSNFILLGYLLPLAGFIFFWIFSYQSRNVLGRLFEHSAWIVINRNKQVKRVNHEAKMLFGDFNLSKSRDIEHIFDPQASATLDNVLKESEWKLYSVTTEMQMFGGSVKNVEIKVIPIPGFHWYRRNVVLLFRVAEETMAEQLTNWIIVAQGLAHDLKSPVRGIMTRLDRMSRKIAAQTSNLELVEQPTAEIKNELLEVQSSLRKFLTYLAAWRKKSFPCDINEMIGTIVEELQNDAPGVRIRQQLASELEIIRINHDLLRIALKNVFNNAVEAAGERGEVFIITDMEEIAEKGEKQFRKRILIEVQDTGQGIDSDNLQNIWEPGFTTKGSGTGMGLAITRLIFEWFGGSVDLSSETGLGTTVTMRLPAE